MRYKVDQLTDSGWNVALETDNKSEAIDEGRHIAATTSYPVEVWDTDTDVMVYAA